MINIETDAQKEAAVIIVKRVAEATQQGKLEWTEDPSPTFGRDFDAIRGQVLMHLSLHSDGTVCALSIRRKLCTDSLFISSRDAGEEVTVELAKLAKAVMPAGPLSVLPGWVRDLHDELA